MVVPPEWMLVDTLMVMMEMMEHLLEEQLVEDRVVLVEKVKVVKVEMERVFLVAQEVVLLKV